MLRRIYIIVTVACFVMLLSAVAFSSNGSSGENEIVFLVHQDWRGFDPRAALEDNGHFMSTLLYSQLLNYNSDTWDIEGDLAKTWENLTDKSYIFHLYEGVKFHDGHELTAEDVKYTFDSILDPDSRWVTKRAQLEPIESVEVVDDYTVKINLKRVFSSILDYLTICIVPKHIAEGDPYRLETDPIGSGPMKFVELESISHLILESFDDYFRGKPAVDRLVFKTVLDASSRLIQVSTGDADAATSPPIKKLDEIRADPKLELYSCESTSTVMFGYVDNAVPPFDDKRVRQALRYAIDTDEINTIATNDTYVKQCGVVTSTNWAYNPNINCYEQDLEKARQLLQEAGVPEGFEFKYTTDYHWRSVPELEVSALQFRKVGLSPQLNIMHWDVVWPLLKAGKLEAFMGMSKSNCYSPDQMLYRLYHSSMQPPYGFNYWHYENERVDKLLDESRVTVDREKQKEIYWEIQEIINEECPIFPLYIKQLFFVYDPETLVDFQLDYARYFYNFVMNTHKKGE